MKITWLGQSGYLLSDGKTTICIDPYLSDAVNRIAGRPRMVEAPIRPEGLCFASNTEDPHRFAVPNRFIMEFNREYEI